MHETKINQLNNQANDREQELLKNGNDMQNSKDQINKLQDKIKEQAIQMNEK